MKRRLLFLVLASFIFLGMMFPLTTLAVTENWVFEKTLKS